MQLAVNKQGVIAGTYYNEANQVNRPIQGTVDVEDAAGGDEFRRQQEHGPSAGNEHRQPDPGRGAGALALRCGAVSAGLARPTEATGWCASGSVNAQGNWQELMRIDFQHTLVRVSESSNGSVPAQTPISVDEPDKDSRPLFEFRARREPIDRITVEHGPSSRQSPRSRAKTTKPLAGMTMAAEQGRPCIGPPVGVDPCRRCPRRSG